MSDESPTPSSNDPASPPPGPPPPDGAPTAPPPPTTTTDGDAPADATNGEPAPSEIEPMPIPEAEDEDEERRRRLLFFIIGGSVAAALLLIVGIVLLLQPSSGGVSSAPPTSATNSQATMTLVPSGIVPAGTTVTAKITLVSTAGFKSAIVLLDGAPVAQAASPSDPLAFTPAAGKHTAIAKVTLTTGEEVTTPPVELTVGAVSASTGTSAPVASTASSSAPATSSSTTTSAPAGGPLDPSGLSASGARPLKFGDSIDLAKTTFAGEQPVSTCAPIAPAFTGGRQFTYFGFPGNTFSYFLTRDPTMATVEGVKVGMTEAEAQKLIPGLVAKTNADGLPLLVQKSTDGQSELVLFMNDGKVLFIAGSVGDLAESKQC